MALTKAEQKELKELERLENQKGVGLSAEEEKELAELEAYDDTEITTATKPIEEQHPDVSFGKRWHVKSFSNSPEDTVNHLREVYPDLEIGHKDGRVLIKRPGEEKYRVLDPATGMFSKDAVKDIAEAGWDTASGFAETGAATLAGALGTVVGGPGGGVGGVLAGSGLASGGLEYLRQVIGQKTGIKQDRDDVGIAIAGALGPVSTALFGAPKYMKGGMTHARKWATRKVLPTLLGTVNKISGKSFELLGKFPRLMDDVGEHLDINVRGFANRLRTASKAEIKRWGKLISRQAKNTKESVDLRPAKKILSEKLEELNKKEISVGLDAREKSWKKDVGALYDDIFKRERTIKVTSPDGKIVTKKVMNEKPNAVDIEETFGMRHALNKFMDNADNPNLDTYNKEMSAFASDIYKTINKSIEIISPRIKKLNKGYSEAIGKDKNIKNIFIGRYPDETTKKTFNALTSPETRSKTMLNRALKRVERETGENIGPLRDKLKAYAEFNEFGEKWLAPTVRGGLLSGAGYMAGSNFQGAGTGRMGATTAMVLGGLGMSPRASRGLIRGNRAVETWVKGAAKKLHYPKSALSRAYRNMLRMDATTKKEKLLKEHPEMLMDSIKPQK